MIDASISGRNLIVNGRKIRFDQRIEKFVVLDDRVIVALRVSAFEVGDSLVGRNILAFDEKGEMLWRIPATGARRSSRFGGTTPEAYLDLYVGDGGKIHVGSPSGVRFDLDPMTGEISNGVIDR